jgi:hypothetical protein
MLLDNSAGQLTRKKKAYPHYRADATASARCHVKLVSEGNFIIKEDTLRYQLYVIGGPQADH